MAESTRLVDLIQLRIDDFISERSAELTAIAPELSVVTDVATDFLDRKSTRLNSSH